MQREMFEPPGLQVKPKEGSREPRLWFRRFVIWPEPGAKPIQDRTFGPDVAKKKNQAWFKSREQGAFLGGLVAEHWSAIANTPTHAVIGKLRAFAHG